MDRTLSIVGLGYVGLPVAVAFAEKFSVIGFDINQERVKALSNGFDYTGEVEAHQLKNDNIHFSFDPETLAKANFHIVAVPTPIDKTNQPDLSPLINASKTLGQYLKKDDIVVFESTVYPGVTEEVCLPVLEEASTLTGGRDFFVGYSPERINPGDKEHTFQSITKVVSGQSKEIENIIAEVYGSVVKAGIYKAGSIKVAEAAKVIENTQRDLNIAFVNELALICNRLKISVYDVLEAAKTKWNFLPFSPGLVGGHCIGVDPYYLTHLSEKLGYHPQVILSGRRINDSMGKYIAELTVKEIIKAGLSLNHLKVGIFGLTFKENCPDIRNSKVIDIINELSSYQVYPVVYDPIANSEEAYNEHHIELTSFSGLSDLKVVVLAVGHKEFLSEEVLAYLESVELIIDVKNILPRDKNFKKIIKL